MNTQHQPDNIPYDHQIKLLEGLVTTVPEVVRRWGKQRKSVMMQIWKSNIAAVQHGNTWIVYVPSVIALWGAELGDISNELD